LHSTHSTHSRHRPKFVVLPSPPKPALVKRARSKPPSFTVTHKSFGEGKIVALHVSASGNWLATIVFGKLRRTLQLRAEYFVTPIADIIALAQSFPSPKFPVEKKEKVIAAPEESAEDREPELGEEPVENDDDSEIEVEENEEGTV
jgi:hypothetical protein